MRIFPFLLLVMVISIFPTGIFAEQKLAIETSNGWQYYSLEELSLTFSEFDETDSLAVCTGSQTDLFALSEIDSVSFSVTELAVDNYKNLISLPDLYLLEPAFPNPFNPSTKIKVKMTEPGQLKLRIYNVKGQEVAVLADQFAAAGEYSFTFEARDISSGVYFINAIFGNEQTITQKIVLMK